MKILGTHIGYINQGRILFLIFMLLLLIFLYLTYIRKTAKPREGFTQDAPFLVKRGDQEVYDDFLAQIYNRIWQPRGPNQYIFDAVEKLTESSKEKSVILDAGCGTGELAGYAFDKGYKYVYAIDQSQDMINYCAEKWPKMGAKQGNFLVPMSYDKGTFTHVFMTGDTIYHIQDKLTLLRNMFYWLMPNGYLILHLYDPLEFDPVPLAGRPVLVDSLKDIASERITNSTIDFLDFVFKSVYDFSKVGADNSIDSLDADAEVLHQTVFIDSNTKNVRQNETILYMNSVNSILRMCQYVGFLVHGQMNLGDSTLRDPHQYIFLLERPH
mgnify:CR=1 FL=1